jgi:dTDP-4-dehydrorhamnose reductase
MCFLAAGAQDVPVAPLNVYGQSQLAGEQAIQASGCAHLILCISWVYVARGSNVAQAMLHLVAERGTLAVD